MRNRYLLAADLPLLALAAFGAFVLRFDWFFLGARPEFFAYVAAAVLVKPVTLYAGGIYARYWQYATTGDMLALLLSVSASSVAMAIVVSLFLAVGVVDFFSRSVVVIDWLLTLVVIAGVRLAVKLQNDLHVRAGVPPSSRNVIVVGAGNTGMVVVREIHRNRRLEKHVIGFLDDDGDKVGKQIYGLPVLGRLADLAAIVTARRCDEIIIAMPSAPGATVREVADRCRQLGLRSLTMPGVYEMLNGQVSVSALREVDIADLLRRTPARTRERAHHYVRGRRVLVTGAGGSIGSELCRQIAYLEPQQLILLGHGENSLFDLSQDLGDQAPALDHRVAVADIRDERRIRQIFQHVDHIAAFIAYAAGFAAGNWVGLIIEEKMALGLLAVRVITAEDATGLAARLRGANFGVTTVSAKGQSGDVQLVFMIIERREYDRVIAMIRDVHPAAFISVEDVRTARQGIFPRGPLEQRFPAFQRKSK